MSCPGCGGVVGRDCFNPVECEQIAHAQEAQHYAQQAAYDQELRHEIDMLKQHCRMLEERIAELEGKRP